MESWKERVNERLARWAAQTPGNTVILKIQLISMILGVDSKKYPIPFSLLLRWTLEDWWTGKPWKPGKNACEKQCEEWDEMYAEYGQKLAVQHRIPYFVISKHAGYELLDFPVDHLVSGRLRFVNMCDPSTGRNYLIRVPPQTNTVEEAMNFVKRVPEGQDYFKSIKEQT
jgi:hypothetical protein